MFKIICSPFGCGLLFVIRITVRERKGKSKTLMIIIKVFDNVTDRLFVTLKTKVCNTENKSLKIVCVTDRLFVTLCHSESMKYSIISHGTQTIAMNTVSYDTSCPGCHLAVIRFL